MIEFESSLEGEWGVSQVGSIRKKLEEALPRVMKNYVDRCLENLGSAGPGDLEDLRILAYEISELFVSIKEFGYEDIDEIAQKLDEWEKATGALVPPRLLSCLASLYGDLTDSGLEENRATACYEKSRDLYQRILDIESDRGLIAITQRKLADMLLSFPGPDEGRENREKSVSLYKDALVHYSSEKCPREFAAIHNNLGVALCALADSDESSGYMRDAAESFSRAIETNSIEGCSSEERALIRFNLAAAYMRLACVENTKERYSCALDALRDVLDFYTRDDYPAYYAFISRLIGDASRQLAETENGGDNFNKAISAYEDALDVYDEDTYPCERSLVTNKIGLTYLALASMEGGNENRKDYLHKAVSFLAAKRRV